MTLDLWAGNIAQAAVIPRLADSLGDAHAGIVTEAYHYTKSPTGYRLIRATDGMSKRQARRLGAERHDVAMLVHDDVRVPKIRAKRMGRIWWGPFTRKRREARVYFVVTLEVDGVRWKVLAVHFPPGGPSGGRITRGRNKGAWHESARFSKRWLRLRRRGVVIGDLNARGFDVRKYVAPKGVDVRMISSVDGAIAKGATITARRQNAPAGMHGWGRYSITPKEKP